MGRKGNRKKKKTAEAAVVEDDAAGEQHDGAVSGEDSDADDDLSSRLASLLSAREEEEAGHAAEQTKDQGESGKEDSNRVSRKQKRLAKKKREEEERAREYEAVKSSYVSDSQIENQRLAVVLADHKLAIHDIQPDGHCLYRSLAHQLQLYGHAAGAHEDPVFYLRGQAASYMERNREETEPFIDTGEPFAEYINKLRNSAEWGGQLEILAIAKELDACVRVYRAVGDPIVVNEEAAGPTLRLSYHEHLYGLGAHYNSLVSK